MGACRKVYNGPRRANCLEDTMKKLALAAAFAGAATTAMAGSYEAPAKDYVVMEPEVVVEETQQSSSSAGILIPLVLIAVVAAAAS
ncbi:hypothetical protein GCM10011324_07720 [Allosediminivita pacifica]|nr:hypothetical protein GCM10011324_07720 [Allosediminivita pacifica]